MFQQRESHRRRDMFLLSGWLFADLLLALMMIFLVSLNGGTPPPKPCSTPASGTATAATQASHALAHPLGVNARAASTSTPTDGTLPIATPTPCPTPTAPTPPPTPSPTPFPCGLDLTSAYSPKPIDVSASDMAGLLIDNPTAQQDFDNQVKVVFAAYANRIAGLVEVSGGGNDPPAAENFAQHAINALEKLGQQQPPFIFESKYAVFQNFWNGDTQTNQVSMYVIFYYQSTNGSCIQQ